MMCSPNGHLVYTSEQTTRIVILADRGNYLEKVTRKKPAYCVFIFCPQLPVFASVKVRVNTRRACAGTERRRSVPSVHLEFGCYHVVGGQYHAPAAVLLEENLYPLYNRIGGPCGRSRQARKISPPGFDLWTVQAAASRCTD